jgi:hypothetical protein
VGAEERRKPKCGPATGCSFAARDSYDGSWERYLSFKRGEVHNDEWYSDYDEEQDSTYEYESEEDDEPLEYDSDVSDGEVRSLDEEETEGVCKSIPEFFCFLSGEISGNFPGGECPTDLEILIYTSQNNSKGIWLTPRVLRSSYARSFRQRHCKENRKQMFSSRFMGKMILVPG